MQSTPSSSSAPFHYNFINDWHVNNDAASSSGNNSNSKCCYLASQISDTQSGGYQLTSATSFHGQASAISPSGNLFISTTPIGDTLVYNFITGHWHNIPGANQAYCPKHYFFKGIFVNENVRNQCTFLIIVYY